MRTLKITLFFILIIGFVAHSQSTASSNVSTFTIEAPQLHTHKKIWVYLPKDYKSSNTNYPVIYMHDAQNLFDIETAYAREWNVDEYLDTLTTKQVIIVAIAHGNDKRIDELTPYPNTTYGGGNGVAYIDFITKTLKPHIDITYPTRPDAKNTTIFGSSLGGLISFYAIIQYPDIFGNAGVFSPSFWFSDAIYELVNTTELNKNSRFYFVMGTKESETAVPNLKKMVQLLKDNGIKEQQIINKIVANGTHSESFWSTQFPEAHKWLIQE